MPIFKQNIKFAILHLPKADVHYILLIEVTNGLNRIIIPLVV